MMADKQIFTKDSFEKLEAELEELKVVRRKDIAQKIKEAREQGDLSENAEYDAAKDEQRDIEARIEELENIIKNAEVLDESTIDYSKIHVGSFVTVKERTGAKREITYKIVDTSEVNSREKKISYESPVGKALMGKEAGVNVDIETPGGILKYKITKVD